jgi:hypothetical protein
MTTRFFLLTKKNRNGLCLRSHRSNRFETTSRRRFSSRKRHARNQKSSMQVPMQQQTNQSPYVVSLKAISRGVLEWISPPIVTNKLGLTFRISTTRHLLYQIALQFFSAGQCRERKEQTICLKRDNETTSYFELTNPFQTGSNQGQLDFRSVKPNDFYPGKGKPRSTTMATRLAKSRNKKRDKSTIPEQPPRSHNNRGVERKAVAFLS